MTVLESLRTNPQGTIGSSYIYVKTCPNITAGCNIVIKETQCVHGSVWSVEEQSGARDFYFPYVWQCAGNVCVANPEEEAVVVTSPMNGCAVEVRYWHNQYIFYHDTNGKCMGKANPAGTLVCRIEAKAYWDERYGECAPDALPVVQFIFVFKDQRWHVGAFGMQIDRNNDVCKTFVPVGGKYRGTFSLTHCLVQRDRE